MKAIGKKDKGEGRKAKVEEAEGNREFRKDAPGVFEENSVDLSFTLLGDMRR